MVYPPPQRVPAFYWVMSSLPIGSWNQPNIPVTNECRSRKADVIYPDVRSYQAGRCTVLNREIETGISEASKRVPIFLYDVKGGKQVSSYFRQRNWVQAREAQIRFPAG